MARCTQDALLLVHHLSFQGFWEEKKTHLELASLLQKKKISTFLQHIISFIQEVALFFFPSV
jgi:hypothetical protein